MSHDIPYETETLKLINGDCVKEMQKMTEKSIDVFVFSPPYNKQHKYNTYSDNLPYQEYLSWMSVVYKEIHRLLKDDGSIFMNIGCNSKNLMMPYDVCNSIQKCGFILQNDIVWIKSISIFNQKWKTYGHFKPIPSRRYLNYCYESIFHFTKTGNVEIDRLAIGVPYEQDYNASRWKRKKENLRCRGNVWHIPYKTVSSTTANRKDHPAGYPVELVENCIKLHGLTDNMVVLDPFLGSGTTLEACKKLGVHGIGIEIDPQYCDIAKNRLM